MPTTQPIDWPTLLADFLIRPVAAAASRAGGRAYLVGGAVRDAFRAGALPLDLDFCLVDAPAETLARQLADDLDGYLVTLDPEFGVYRVVMPDKMTTLDLSNALDNSLETDLARRDLTVNAMAVDVGTGELIDPYQGLSDLEAGIIRMVSEANLLDDPLRMLRTYRVGATVQAEQLDPATRQAVKTSGSRLLESAAERIRYELFRMLSAPVCFPYLKMMADDGLLEALFPEFSPMRDIPPNGYHHLGLFDHTLELVNQAERIIDRLPESCREHLLQPFTPAVTRFGLVKLGCLLHDVGKPATKDWNGERFTYYGHDKVSEDMTEVICGRLKTSTDTRQFLKKLVRWHLYPGQFGKDSPKKSVLRFLRRMGDDTPDVILLAMADRHSTLGEGVTAETVWQDDENMLYLLSEYEARREEIKTPPLLNGREVMDLLDVGPGPHLREILEGLKEARQLGEIATSDEARSWVRQHFAHLASPR